MFGEERTFTLNRFKEGNGETVKAIAVDKLRRYTGDRVKLKYIKSVEYSRSGQLFYTGCLERTPPVMLNSQLRPAINGQAAKYNQNKVDDQGNVVQEVGWRKCWQPATGVLQANKARVAEVEIKCAAMLMQVTILKRLPPFVIDMRDFEVRGGTRGQIMSAAYTMPSEGITLEQWLRSVADTGRVAKDHATFARQLDGIFAQIVLALYFLQKHAGFVHNDFHSNNIMVIERPGTGNMRVVVDRVNYVFEEDIPLVKLIDFGQSHARNPLTGETLNSMFWSPLVAQNNSWDLVRVAITLLQPRPMRTNSNALSPGHRENVLFSRTLTRDLLSVADSVSPTPNWWLGGKSNLNWFSFPTQAMTPAKLIENGEVLQTFVSDALASYHNTFVELPNDGWPVDLRRFSRLETERRLYDDYEPVVVSFIEPRLVRAPGRIRDVVLKMMDRRLIECYDAEKGGPLFCYGGCEESVKKRMLYKALILFQRAVIFYLKTFCRCTIDGQLHDEFTTRALAFRESLVEENNYEHHMELRYCLFAACGGFPEFLGAFSGIPVHGDRRDNHFKNSAEHNKMQKEIVQMFEDFQAPPLRRRICAPLECVSIHDIHAADLQTLRGAFVWSSEMCFYSYDVKSAIKISINV